MSSSNCQCDVIGWDVLQLSLNLDKVGKALNESEWQGRNMKTQTLMRK